MQLNFKCLIKKYGLLIKREVKIAGYLRVYGLKRSCGTKRESPSGRGGARELVHLARSRNYNSSHIIIPLRLVGCGPIRGVAVIRPNFIVHSVFGWSGIFNLDNTVNCWASALVPQSANLFKVNDISIIYT